MPARAKQKEPRYSNALTKDRVEGSSQPFRFNVLTQIANISIRITMYDLLNLSKMVQVALTEALVDAEV